MTVKKLEVSGANLVAKDVREQMQFSDFLYRGAILCKHLHSSSKIAANTDQDKINTTVSFS